MVPFSPRRFQRRLVGFNIVLILFSILLGLIKTGNPSRYFGEGRFTTYFSSAQLLSIGIVAFLIFRIRQRQTQPPEDTAAAPPLYRSPRLVWLLAAGGFVFLAFDEALELHERMDHFIVRSLDLPRTPLTTRIDDAIMAAYGLTGLAVLWIFRREWLPFRPVMLKPIALGFICLFLGLLCDTAAHDDHFFHWLTGNLPLAKKLNGWFSALEGGLTLLPEALFLSGFYAGWHHVRGGHAARTQSE